MKMLIIFFTLLGKRRLPETGGKVDRISHAPAVPHWMLLKLRDAHSFKYFLPFFRYLFAISLLLK